MGEGFRIRKEAGGNKALLSMVFIKVRSLIASVNVTGAFMSTWRVPTLVCKAQQ